MEKIELIEDYPSNIATQLLNNQIDIGLVPVAIIPKLKEAHTAQDIPAIEVALTELNNAWQTASQDMYNASQGGAQQEGAADQNANNNTEDVQDAEVVEEVK